MAKQLSALTRQAMAHPPLSAIEREWIGKYESETGFEPMHLDELMRDEMTFAEMAKINKVYILDGKTGKLVRIK